MSRKRWWVIVITAILIGVSLAWAWRAWVFSRSDRGFAYVTGRDLPQGLTIERHTSAVNDNLFHESHYWLVSGPTAGLRALAPAPAFERSDEDAAQFLSEPLETGIVERDAKMIEGYEGSFDGGRDRWLVILAPGDRAIVMW